MPDVTFHRIDPTAGRYRLAPIRDRDRKVYRAEVGDAHAIIVPTPGEVRVPVVEASNDTGLSDLLGAIVDAVDCRKVRFVSVRESGTDFDRAWRRLFDDTPALDEVADGFDRVEEEWEDPEGGDTATVVCLVGKWKDVE